MNSLNIIMKLLESRYRFFSSFDKKFSEPWQSMLEYNVAHSLLNEKLHLHPRDMCFTYLEFPRCSQNVPLYASARAKEEVYLVVETKSLYLYSNSNRLYLEARLLAGVNYSDLIEKNLLFRDYLLCLSRYVTEFIIRS